eukprot:scaffold55962_cov33-Tisochrysis_lutea.AAC.2
MPTGESCAILAVLGTLAPLASSSARFARQALHSKPSWAAVAHLIPQLLHGCPRLSLTTL